MTGTVVSVLGGSSPFTAGLVDSLAQLRDSLGTSSLMLHGRSTEALNVVARYAECQLAAHGWQVASTTSLPVALTGADIVIHQIRYGGLSGRAQGEQVSRELQLPADETLGPAALLTGIKTLPHLEKTSNAIIQHAPTAIVVNLTNPLSSVTAAMIQYGVKNCVGMCELPLVTQQAAAEVFNVPSHHTSWTYVGLNHRGFIDSLEFESRDLLADLPGILGNRTLLGITAAEIESLQAIPLKYFQLFRKPPAVNPGRADFLAKLRRRILRELTESSSRSPPSLRERYMDWYPKSVVPLIVALRKLEPTSHVLNLPRDDGLVIETMADVSSEAIHPRVHSPSNDAVKRWMTIFECHERHFLATLFDPTPGRLHATLEHDPMIPTGQADEVAIRIHQLLR